MADTHRNIPTEYHMCVTFGGKGRLIRNSAFVVWKETDFVPCVCGRVEMHTREGATGTYVKQQMVLEDPLHRLQQVGAQRQGVAQRFLTFAEKLGQRLVPHALGEYSHRPAESKQGNDPKN